MADETRFVGDDTINGYSGQFKTFLICVQLELRIAIFTRDAFPRPNDFETYIKDLFEVKMQHTYEKKCENRSLLGLLI